MMVHCALEYEGILSTSTEGTTMFIFLAESSELCTDSARNEKCEGKVRMRCNQLFL